MTLRLCPLDQRRDGEDRLSCLRHLSRAGWGVLRELEDPVARRRGALRDALQQAPGGGSRGRRCLDAARDGRKVASDACHPRGFPGTRMLRPKFWATVGSLPPIDGLARAIIGNTTRGPSRDVEPPHVGGVRALIEGVQNVTTVR